MTPWEKRLHSIDWKKKNPDKVRDSNRRWRSGNPAKHREQSRLRMQKYRAKLRSVTVST